MENIIQKAFGGVDIDAPYVLHAKVEKNEKGRDFFVGDIHGTFHILEEALQCINFDKEKDRLFCTGDLLDRGESEHLILDYLGQPWFYCIMGNHDDMLRGAVYNVADLGVSMYHKARNIGRPEKESLLSAREAIKEGISPRFPFVNKLSVDEFVRLVDCIFNMPITMEVENDKGLIGMIHAEASLDMSWADYIEAITKDERNNHSYAHYSFWGDRGRVIPPFVEPYFTRAFDACETVNDGNKLLENTVKDLHLLFSGHNIMPVKFIKKIHTENAKLRLDNKRGNLVFLDHGSFVAHDSGFETDAFGLGIYDDDGECVLFLDSIPL